MSASLHTSSRRLSRPRTRRPSWGPRFFAWSGIVLLCFALSLSPQPLYTFSAGHVLFGVAHHPQPAEPVNVAQREVWDSESGAVAKGVSTDTHDIGLAFLSALGLSGGCYIGRRNLHIARTHPRRGNAASWGQRSPPFLFA
ncbi:MAG: hypothetical protein AB2L09_08975 [Coriobacteriia bacterium]